ncbi:MAG: CRISPR system precrRNA processing endoribonuclease RAMP protein Cas6 [Oscillochloridaceae bacterium umkhey_bin13]
MPDPIELPQLTLLRTRLTYRLLDDAPLPAYKGGLLRGGFGYAFQRATCPEPCWGHANACPQDLICPYRWVFETPRPAGIAHLHDLNDIPRPFVIDLPHDPRTQVERGASLEFGLTMLGRGIDYLPFFLFGFDRLGELGLGIRRVKAVLERVSALAGWDSVGPTIYAEGQVVSPTNPLPLLDTAAIVAHATALPSDLRITLRTPLRIKARGALLHQLEPAAIVRAISWRLSALTAFHGPTAWNADYRPLVAAAATLPVRDARVRWEEWERHSDHGGRDQRMQLGGIVGQAILRDVPLDVRIILLMGSLVHVGKACVFGHGAYRLDPA